MLKPTIFICSIACLALVSCEKNKEKDDSQSTDSAPSQSPPPQQANSTVNVKAGLPVSFNEHIQPILSSYCYHCHGPDAGSRQPEKNPLRLDLEEDAFTARENGKPVIIKGKPDASYLIELLESDDKEKVMPPHPDHNPHGKIMKPEEITLIRRWIEEGAAFEDHWAYIAPEKQALPEVDNKDWARNHPIDSFVAAAFEKSGLQPSPQEKPARLYRRLFFDLTGLPPTAEELENRLNDPREFDTVYNETVDQLLKTDAYAEHWARHWLDVARYADTHGIHIDNYRSIWPYRDWVIKAFKKNMPFDQFTREQMAGDMMPDATLDQIIATGFNRCLPTTGEGGAIAEEYNAIYAQDRTDTTAAAWLGLTTGCAACHDHKFDAISTKENYQLTAFFRNTPMSALDRNNAQHPPNVMVQTKEEQITSASLAQQITHTEKTLAEHQKTSEPDFQQWLETQQSRTPHTHSLPAPVLELPLNQIQDKGIIDSSGIKHTTEKPVQWTDGPIAKAAHLQDNAIIVQPAPSFESDQAFSYGAWLNLPNRGIAGLIAKIDIDHHNRGFDLWVNGNKLYAHIISEFPDDSLKVIMKDAFPHKTWFHAMVTYDGSRKASGLKIYINGKSVKLGIIRDSLNGSITNNTPLTIGRRHKAPHARSMKVTGLQIYNRTLTPEECLTLGKHSLIDQLMALPSPDAQQLQKIRDHYFGTIDHQSIELSQKIATLKQKKKTHDSKAPVTLVMKENVDKKPFAHILSRGNYTEKLDQVFPDTPASLPPMGDLPKNRLGLAQWLTMPENPLPARITVNRYWYYLFGRGIVETTGDFGVMGARPSHPKLLDWLAVDFVENNWDLHHLLRTIVTSSTYRQRSVITDNHLKIDPENILLSRGPRYRLDAEQIRDLALKASQLLHHKVGGPSVKPYQPEGIWSAVAMPSSNTKKYQRDTGESLYRRSLYTFWKRTAPHPAMDILNAPVREISCVRRELTNTPLQAFVLMNDPQFVEASRRLAERVMKEAKSPDARIHAMAVALLARPMNNDELIIVKRTFDRAKKKFTTTPEAAQKLITVGESKPDPHLSPTDLAALTMVANQILNMDETLNK
ncbi:MAG: DUF1553 domain-containing protein [Verrucomicrobiae bacterium]|nr:DUF1553 domain-containing protein [Verrucomicrobiae bacterium]NNJ44086.1 DUF1553 domain-containing protein [Akkermansiaceae bacterium]